MGLGLKCLKQGTGDCAVIFIHGVLSDGDKCWRHDNGTYWPDLLVRDDSLSDPSILVYTYETGIFSADYDLDNVVADLRQRMRNAEIDVKPRIVFVCHSMGGIVARRYLVIRRLDNASSVRTTFGLFLVASPSLGSEWADWLKPIAQCLGHSQADALQFSNKNGWLRGLDGEFRTIMDSMGDALHGRELVEDKFIVGGVPFLHKIVEQISAAHYFANPLKIAGSDHSSIAKPESADALQHQTLREFIRSLPKPKRDPAEMIQAANGALNVLIASAKEPAIREIVGQFRGTFESASKQIVMLKEYKGLHDCLHNLQLTLDTIEDALDRAKADRVSAGSLRKHAVVLNGIAREARKQIPGLPNSRLDQAWINKLETYVSYMKRAAEPSATAADIDQLAKIGLRDLLNNASRINQALTDCMAGLPLVPLSQSMHDIADKLRPTAKPGDKALQQLDNGSVAVSDLRRHLELLVSEHHEWQWLSNELDQANVSSNHQPQARMSNWKEFEEGFMRLCDLYPNEGWAKELKQLLAQWIEATPSAEPIRAETLAGEFAFEALYQACLQRFIQVNRDLKDLSEQITSVAGTLNTVLTLIT